MYLNHAGSWLYDAIAQNGQWLSTDDQWCIGAESDDGMYIVIIIDHSVLPIGQASMVLRHAIVSVLHGVLVIGLEGGIVVNFCIIYALSKVLHGVDKYACKAE